MDGKPAARVVDVSAWSLCLPPPVFEQVLFPRGPSACTHPHNTMVGGNTEYIISTYSKIVTCIDKERKTPLQRFSDETMTLPFVMSSEKKAVA